MRAPARAFGRELIARRRWGFLGIGAYLAALAAFRLVAPGAAAWITEGWGARFALVVVTPGTIAFYWMLVVFTYGGEGSLAGRRSIFPTRLFPLPVTTPELVAWPMALGAAAVLLVWIGIRVAAPWPDNLPIGVPYLWMGLLAAVLLGWTQALTWFSYPLPGLRVVAAVLALTVVQVAVTLAIEFRATEPLMVALLAPQLPLAYLLACRAVSRARRGDIADWSGAFGRLGRRVGPRRRPFAGPAAAQRWLEWQRYGRSLPVMVALVLPAELLLLWVSRGAASLILTIVIVTALTPPVLASFTALTVRKSGEGSDYGLSPFTATRPLSSAELVAARLRMAVGSTGAAWLLVALAVPAALMLSDTWDVVARTWRGFAGVVGTPRAVGFGLLVLGALVLTTWRQMVQSLYVGLTGRAGLIRGTAFGVLCLIVVIGPLLDWAWHSGARAWFWVALYWTLGLIVAARMALASWIAVRLQRDRLVTERSLLAGALRWLGAVALVYAVLLWLFSTPYVPRFLLLMLATVAVPLVRVWAAPLALGWNRHR
jgi:hypothetical protein